MAFSQKVGALAGSEQLALFNETGGNAYVTTQQIANLAGAGANGLFSSNNYWDGSVDGGLAPTTGLLSPSGSTAGIGTSIPGLFMDDDLVIGGQYTQAGVVTHAPGNIGFQVIGMHTIELSTGDYVHLTGGDGPQIRISDIDQSVLIDNASDSFSINSNGINLDTSVGKLRTSSTVTNYFGSTSGGATTQAQFSFYPTQVPGDTGIGIGLRAPSGNYFIGNTGANGAAGNFDQPPDQVDTALQVLAVDTTEGIGRIVMRTVASIVGETDLNLGSANQVIPDSTTRTVTGNAANSVLQFSSLNEWSASATSTVDLIQGSNNIKISAQAIRLNHALGSYTLGDGFGGNLPPDTILSTFLTIDGNGNIGKRTATLSNTNFANTDLTFTSPRTHDGDGNAFTMSNFGTITMSGSTSTLTLGASFTRLTHDGGGANLAAYYLGTGTGGSSNTLMPEDPGNTYDFLKIDEATGRLYRESVALAADGNGVYDVANDASTWLVSTWTYASSSVATLTDTLTISKAGFSHILGGTIGVVTRDSGAGGAANYQYNIQSDNNGSGILFSEDTAQEGVITYVDSTQTYYQIQDFTSGSAGDTLVRIDRSAPALVLDISSSGQVSLSKYAAAATPPTGTPAQLLAVNTDGDVIAEDVNNYLNSALTPQWRQITKAGEAIVSASQILDLSTGTATGNGTTFVATGSGIAVNAATYADVSVSVSVDESTVSGSGDVELYDQIGASVLATFGLLVKGGNNTRTASFRYMGALAGTERLVIRVVNLSGVTVNDIKLNVRN